MSGFLAAAVAMMLALVPCLWLMLRSDLMSAVVGYELASSIVVMILLCLAQGFGRSGEVGLALLLAVLLYGSGLVFVRSLERWL